MITAAEDQGISTYIKKKTLACIKVSKKKKINMRVGKEGEERNNQK